MTLSVYEFGEKLVEINDLDPVYVLLWEASFPQEKLWKWLVAYWSFYHVGTASWITDQRDYWEAFRKAAESKDWPRCHERRHFRGKLAIKSTEWLATQGIGALRDGIMGVDSSLSSLMAYVAGNWVGFGPWIAFKIADMLERLDVKPIEFDDGAMFLFDSPKEGAEQVRKETGLETNQEVIQSIIDRIGLVAPPRYERMINVQEAETILCKRHSYTKGHYKLGEDVQGCRNGLMKFNKTRTAQELFAAGRRVLW